ncbi:MAG: hypothetical protein ACLQRH_27135 [Acidimicrobiales bacterium]
MSLPWYVRIVCLIAPHRHDSGRPRLVVLRGGRNRGWAVVVLAVALLVALAVFVHW